MANCEEFFKEEEIEGVLAIITYLYIQNGGKMPTDRQIKKCKEVNGSRYALMRRFIPNRVSERVVRGRALEAGYEFASPEDKHLKGLRNVLEKRTVMLEEETFTSEGNKATIKVDSERKCGRRPGRYGASPVEVLSDFKDLMRRLGHEPTVKDMKDKNNGAKYSYETYSRLVGDRKKRKAIWEEMQEQLKVSQS